ncbi:MAG: pseudouridine synthase [Pseudomonadota bacterium]
MPTNPDKSADRPEGDRIAKLLARAGVASRREIERMIADKRITLNGKTVETPATFLTDLKGVSVDGKAVGPVEATMLVAFHKPTGLITAERDGAGRATIYDALRNALPKGTPRLMPIGRLDLNTEGLLLLTNDGGLKREMELPSTGIPRIYRARAYGEVTQDQLEGLIEGIEIDGVRYGSIDANLERGGGSSSGPSKAKNHWIEMTITEGKNREVRRVLEFFELKVSRLIRTSYGPFALGDLPRGRAEIIRKGDLSRFQSQLKRGYGN